MPKLSVSLCSVDGCVRRVTGRGYCNLHYRRFRSHGTPLGGQPTYRGQPSKYLEEAIKTETDDCVIWPFAKSKGGYGTVYYKGKLHNTHRLVLILFSGDPPSADLLAAHAPGICHSRSCINPRHLRWASHAENAADQIIDGTRLLGEDTNSAKLCKDLIAPIRRDRRHNEEIAACYGVTRSAIAAIKSRTSWEWVDD